LFPQEDPVLRAALVIANISLEFYFSDIKLFVISSVKADINTLIESDDPLDHQLAKQRQKDLKHWQDFDHPLSYRHYLDLCRIINPSGTSLPPSSAGQLVLKSFCASLVDLGRARKKHGAPFIKDGSFQSVLPCAIKRLTTYAIRLGASPKPYITDVFLRCWRVHHANFIPWSPVHDNTRSGRPITTVVYNAWASFGGVTLDINPTSLRPNEARNVATIANRDKALEDDADSPWTTGDLKIQDIHTILNRRVNPDDLKQPSFPTNAPITYVEKTYTHVRLHLSPEKPLHQLALIIAIVFSKLAPTLFTKKPSIPNSNALLNYSSTKEYLDTLPWQARSGKGITQRSLLVTMVTTYIIALYDDFSPLREYFDIHKQLGSPWTEKHSAQQFFLSSYYKSKI
jgi:hypothetical protein